MHPEPLFLQRCEQLALILASKKEIDLLDTSRLLRQLIADKHSLMDAANSNRLKIMFRVSIASASGWAVGVGHVMSGSMIDPQVIPGGDEYAIPLPKDKFLQHEIGRIYDGAAETPITVKDLICYAAHKAGGVHYDAKPKSEYDALAMQSEKFFANFGDDAFEMMSDLQTLRAIARVTLRALQPLIEDVKSRQK